MSFKRYTRNISFKLISGLNDIIYRLNDVYLTIPPPPPPPPKKKKKKKKKTEQRKLKPKICRVNIFMFPFWKIRMETETKHISFKRHNILSKTIS